MYAVGQLLSQDNGRCLHFNRIQLHCSVFLSNRLSLCTSVRPSVHPSVHMSVRLSAYMSVWAYVGLSVCNPSIHLLFFVYLPLQSVYLWLCIFIYLFFCPRAIFFTCSGILSIGFRIPTVTANYYTYLLMAYLTAYLTGCLSIWFRIPLSSCLTAFRFPCFQM